MKQITVFTLTLMILVCFSTAPANAGAARRHTIEGFILGTGVALVGTAIIHGMNKEQQHSYNYPRHQRHKSDRHHRRYARYASAPDRHWGGHWEIQKIWIADKYKKRWNPGHYNHGGKWIEGRYKRFPVKKGHWQTQRVWVPR